jgi:hypothetical protein
MEVNMKKVITTAIFTIATTLGFAQDAIPLVQHNLVQVQPTPVLPVVEEKSIFKQSFGYLKMGVSDSNLQYAKIEMIPGFGLGYRIISGSSAFDISAAFNRRDVTTEEGRERSYLYTLPKANYLYYLKSFYAGAGAAWGGVKTGGDNFVGLIANGVIGYELNRYGTLRSFVQLDVSQAAIAAVKKGALPKPFAELSVGAGF